MMAKEKNPLPVVHNPAQNILAKFAKDFGRESACLMSEIHIDVPTLPSGDASIDRMIGGLPIGKITELSGLEGTGKTSLALQWSAQAQRLNPNKYVAYIDAENSLDNAFAAEKYGVDLSRFVYIAQDATSNCAENLLDMLVELSFDPNCALVVLDSVGSLLTETNRDKSHSDGMRDTLPALLSRSVKKIGYARKPGMHPILLLNQLRVSQGGGPGSDPWYTPGGMATRHGPHLRLRIQRIGQIKEGEDVVGFECVLRVMKGRTVKARSMAKFCIDYTHGIDSVRSAVAVGEKQGVIQKRGSMYDLFGQSYKGKAAIHDALRSDRQMLNDLLDNLNPEAVKDDLEPES